MHQEELLKLENQFCFTVYAVSREITRLYRPILDELGITYTQYITLLVLWEQDDLTVKELGLRLHLDSGTLTPLLKKMEAQGLLNRVRDPRDERSVKILLTDEGRKLKEAAYDVPGRVYCQSDLPPEEMLWLQQKLAKLLNNVPNDKNNPNEEDEA